MATLMMFCDILADQGYFCTTQQQMQPHHVRHHVRHQEYQSDERPMAELQRQQAEIERQLAELQRQFAKRRLAKLLRRQAEWRRWRSQKMKKSRKLLADKYHMAEKRRVLRMYRLAEERRLGEGQEQPGDDKLRRPSYIDCLKRTRRLI